MLYVIVAKKQIGNAKEFDRIVVQAGTYTDAVFVKKPLFIEGVGDVRLETRATSPITVNTTGCTIQNITIRQIGALHEVNAVQIDMGVVQIDHCEVVSLGANCIHVSGESQLILTNSKVCKGKQYGVWLSASSAALLENNIIESNGWDGCMLMGGSDCIIRNTQVINNNYNGVAVSSTGRLIVEHSEILQNTWDGVAISNAKCVYRMHDNRFEKNKGFGLYFSKISENPNNMECDNEFVDNGKGDKAVA